MFRLRAMFVSLDKIETLLSKGTFVPIESRESERSSSRVPTERNATHEFKRRRCRAACSSPSVRRGSERTTRERNVSSDIIRSLGDGGNVSGQKRLTNIAVVRYKKGGARFEIACYKNKVLNWRNGIEKDLDEVVQTTTVFSNVSKGIFASKEDLQRVFGTTDEVEIVKVILEKGELQVSDKERELEYANLFKDIVSIIVEKCVNPDTQRPYPAGIIERTLRDLHFAIDPKKTAKQQAMDAIPAIKNVFPIERAKMRLKLTLSEDDQSQLQQLVEEEKATVEREMEMQDGAAYTILIDPGSFRRFDGFVHKQSNGKRKLDVLSLTVVQEGVSDVHSLEKGFGTLSVESDETLPMKEEEQRSSSMPAGKKYCDEKGPPPGKVCTTCRATLENVQKYREHFKTDWHKHNLKRKMKGLSPIREEEVESDPFLEEEKQEYGVF